MTLSYPLRQRFTSHIPKKTVFNDSKKKLDTSKLYAKLCKRQKFLLETTVSQFKF